ncbi:hypothetical protein MRX96_058323 [Rhipicephalus microplus]
MACKTWEPNYGSVFEQSFLRLSRIRSPSSSPLAAIELVCKLGNCCINSWPRLPLGAKHGATAAPDRPGDGAPSAGSQPAALEKGVSRPPTRLICRRSEKEALPWTSNARTGAHSPDLALWRRALFKAFPCFLYTRHREPVVRFYFGPWAREFRTWPGQRAVYVVTLAAASGAAAPPRPPTCSHFHRPRQSLSNTAIISSSIRITCHVHVIALRIRFPNRRNFIRTKIWI